MSMKSDDRRAFSSTNSDQVRVPSQRETSNRISPPASAHADPIRIAIVYATDLERTSLGGIASGLRELVGHLDERFRLTLVGVGEGGGGEEVHKRIDGRDLTIIPVLPSSYRPGLLPLNIIFTARLFRFKARVLQQADLVHPRRMESAIPFIIGKRKPVILTVHGASKFLVLVQTGLLRWRLVQKIYDLVEGFVLSRVDKVIFVSNEGFEYYCERYPRLRNKFLVIPNSIDVSSFSPIDRSLARSMHGVSASDLVVVYVGRLSREKRVELLLEAFARVVRERPVARLLIAGEGPEREPLCQRVASLGLSNVRFLGMLTRDGVRALLSCADVFVLPSLFEGFPNAVLEALSCGVPVVAADVGGVREILTGGLERYILKSVDPETIKARILDAADRREETATLCVARAKQFDTKSVLTKLESVYLSFMETSFVGRGDAYRY